MEEAAPRFLSAETPLDEARVVLLGCPFDETASFRRGARLGPDAIRRASEVLETYSPRLDMDLEDAALCDCGDVGCAPGGVEAALAAIRAAASDMFRTDGRPIFLGGEHLVSLPLIEAALELFPGLAVLQWDAHADLREAYLGERLSHACVMRRVLELEGVGPLRQFGVRSGTRAEFAWMRANGTARPLAPRSVEAALAELGGRPAYLTIDVDVLSPAEMPGTGAPEPGGASFGELEACLRALRDSGARVVGADIVELAPEWDASGASAVAAAKLARELALALSA